MVPDAAAPGAAPSDGGFEELLARCIDAMDRGDSATARAVIEEAGALGGRLRRVLGDLEGFGMVGAEDGEGARGLGRMGPFELIDLIGRGGQGSVYTAYDARLDRLVAVKVLGGARLRDESRRRFRREAEVASRLSHPSLCTVYEAAVDEDGAPWIAMELVPGETLAAKIERARAEGHGAPAISSSDAAASDTSRSDSQRRLHDALELVEEIARAAHAAHEAGIVHRDIKPGNVMVRPDGRPVLMDFGLAQAVEDDATLTRTGDVFGTPAYMAPEQVEPSGPVDARCDVWALGVVLFETLTQRRPFEHASRSGLARAIVEDEPPMLRRFASRIPRDLEVVCRRALEKRPGDRYASAQQLAEDLCRVRHREPVLARPVSAVTRMTRWLQRNPALAASLGLAALVLVAGLVTALVLLAKNARSLEQRDQALGRYSTMSDASLARRLLQAEETLWPALPATVPVMDAWLVSARELLGRREAIESDLAGLGDAAGASDRAPRFERDERTWRREVLSALLADLDALAPVVSAVEKRRAFADVDVRRETAAAAAAWERCVALLAADERFEGVALAPQAGLVPLGRDRTSGLLEFWVLGSGARPGWSGAFEAGAVELEPGSGAVLVLLPPADFEMGSQGTDADDSNYDPSPPPYAQPIHDVELDAFFIGKYELTQGQWLAVFDSNPSTLKAGAMPSGVAVTLGNPVESVDWVDARRGARRLACDLPTEARWEYAARAGTSSPWWTGDDVVSLQGAANVADRTAAAVTVWPCEEALDDGHVAHAPVGSFRANAFGLHDTAGNVSEWVLCGSISYDVDPAPGTGARPPVDSSRVRRGGSFAEAAFHARSADRVAADLTHREHTTGLRLARTLQ